MVKRRSLGDALTPEEESFFKQRAEKPKPKADQQPKPEKKEEPPMPRPIAIKESFTQESPSEIRPQSVGKGAQASAGTGAINARIDSAITTALLRASFERRIEGKTPSTQRDIIAEALTDWLRKNNFTK